MSPAGKTNPLLHAAHNGLMNTGLMHSMAVGFPPGVVRKMP